VEEVKQAALKFAALQDEAEAEGEEKHGDILDTAQSHVNVHSDVRQTGQHYRSPPPLSLLSPQNTHLFSPTHAHTAGCAAFHPARLVTSMANANLLRTKEIDGGGSADPGAPHPLGDIYNTFETLPEEDAPVVQRQYPRS